MEQVSSRRETKVKMEKLRVIELELQAERIRRAGLEAIQAAGSGHVGGSFSAADIMTVLYFEKMNIDPEDPKNSGRDRFVLSKGHCTPALYAALAYRGYFQLEQLKTFRNIDSMLSGHAEMQNVPWVDMSTGSLGQGLSAAAGMALMGKQDGKDYKVYAVLGDGELQEGQIWEAAMAAGNFRLDNLIVFVDNNGLQLDGRVEHVMSPYPIDEKFASFGWRTRTIDGHDVEAVSEAVDWAGKQPGSPVVIIAKTVKGKGVSYMENDVQWHGKVPSKEQFKQAYAELDSRISSLEAQYGKG